MNKIYKADGRDLVVQAEECVHVKEPYKRALQKSPTTKPNKGALERDSRILSR